MLFIVEQNRDSRRGDGIKLIVFRRHCAIVLIDDVRVHTMCR